MITMGEAYLNRELPAVETDGSITGTGGVLLQRTGTDPAFKRHTRADNASLTGVVSHASGDVFVSTAGILRND